MESAGSRSPRRPGNITTSETGGGDDDAPRSRERMMVRFVGCILSCGQETSVSIDGEHPFRLEVFPEEWITAGSEPPRISYAGSHDGSIATTSIGSQVDPVANHFSSTRSSTPTADQTRGHNGLSDSTSPQSRIPPRDSIFTPRYRRVLRHRAETCRDARWERDGELELAVLQFGWDQGEAGRHYLC